MTLSQEWSLVPLDEIAAPEKGAIRRGPFGGSIKKEIFVAEGYKVYEQQNAIESNFDIGRYFIDEQKYKEMEGFNVKPNDLIISCAGTIGRVAIAPSNAKPGIINQALMRIRPDVSVILPRYLKWFLESPLAQREIFGQVAGTALKNLAAISEIKKCLIPLPPIAQQRRIAAILDRADAVRRKRQEAIALTEELLRSAFLEMFGDLEKHGWEMSTVECIASSKAGAIRTGPFGSQLLHSEFVDEGIAVLGIDNAVQNQFRWAKLRFITPEKYKQLKRYTVYPKDVLITIMGTCGRCAIVPDDCPSAINTKHLCCITLNHKRCLPEFLHSYFLMHPHAKRYLEKTVKGAIMDGLNMGIIKKMPVPLVPLELQKKYARLCNQLIQTKEKTISMQQEENSLFNSLLQRAFRGEL